MNEYGVYEECEFFEDSDWLFFGSLKECLDFVKKELKVGIAPEHLSFQIFKLVCEEKCVECPLFSVEKGVCSQERCAIENGELM